MRKHLFTLAVTGLLLLWAVTPGADAQFTGKEISGYVRAQGRSEPPPGTIVQLQLVGGETDQQVTPDSSGRFTFPSLSNSIYYVVAKAPGYREASQRVDLVTSVRFTVTLTLVPEAREGAPEPSQDSVDQRWLSIPKDARKEFERAARELMQNKNPQKAIPHLRKAIEVYPDYYEAYELLGTAYMDQQKWPEAEQALKRSLEIDQEYGPSLIALGGVYNWQGCFAEALPLLEKAHRIDSESWLCHFELSRSLLAQGRLVEATEHALIAHDKNPQSPVVHIALANAALGLFEKEAITSSYAPPATGKRPAALMSSPCPT